MSANDGLVSQAELAADARREEIALRLALLQISNSDLDKAKYFYDWVKGVDSTSHS
jgi:hypothetical protein